MPEEIKPDPNQATTQEGQLAAERMAAGEERPAAVDTEADYKASKEFSVSDIDKTGAGESAAAAATAPHFKVSEPEETVTTATSDANPDDYREMAKDVNPRLS
ncbi:MAG: hypothetical protein KME08_21925 [Aphanothece sp. CMT-3BRIN-NPC111]|jgi:hypothetical protein|nr:hypothetical protein [Aphanothece sp. CMT-3BRIN-NPC111]